MAAFKDFTEFTDPPLQLPYAGKTYTVPAPTIERGALLVKVLSEPDEFRDKPAEWLWELALGPVWAEMLADQVPAAFAVRAGLTALTDFQSGRERAQIAWEHGADPKAMEAYLNQQDSPPSTPSDEAPTTPRRASSTGTRSRKK